MKKLIMISFILSFLPVSAELGESAMNNGTGAISSENAVKPAVVVQNPLTIPQNIMFENCKKIFNVNQEKLFYLTLAAISANKFNIDEMQTSNGYIIFSANRNKYLATVAKVDNTNAILKITPCNNVYRFPPGILINTFKYIDLNITSDIKL